MYITPFMWFLLLSLPFVFGTNLQRPHVNLTHPHIFDFRDTSYTDHTHLRYLYGKHCADSYLHVDSGFSTAAIDDFKSCISTNYNVIEAWFTNLRVVFDELFTQHMYEWENASFYDSEIYNRYRLYIGAQHALNLYKVDLVSTSKHFVDPVIGLTMTSTAVEAYTALNQSLQNIVGMKYTVDSIVSSYRTQIGTKTMLIAAYKSDENAARVAFNSFTEDYTNNVTDVLRKMCAHATALYTCDKGHYCPSDSVQTPCPNGTYLPMNGMTSVDACILCPRQTYSNSGAENCTPCLSNNYVGGTTCQ